MKRVVLLGAGLVGRAIAADLQKEDGLQLTVVDRDGERLKSLEARGIRTLVGDVLSDSVLRREIAGSDLVVGALPGYLGYRVLENLLKMGCSVVDISFFPEDPWPLDPLARKHGCFALIDAGVAPGVSNLAAGYFAARVDRVTSLRIFVGGLPVDRTPPLEYRAPFSPSDVLEEYVRPARVVRNGKLEIKPPLSEVELVEFPEAGTLEAFLTDGLRTLLRTLSAEEMEEKTLRYPGHAEKIRLLKDLGLLDDREIPVGKDAIAPRKLLARLLEERLVLRSGEEDIVVMRVEAEGIDAGDLQRTFRLELIDRYDAKTGLSAMARTTGFTAALLARLALKGKIQHNGLLPPERLGREEELYSFVIRGLQERGITIIQQFGGQ
jgi:saccharopine dehydrogenase-like NADP-dependent oxidoreductase